ncbi:MAG: alpha/beta fold hydrolase [Acetobacteraceae bacterium]|nr:alpha/beta fold hydrolase [Acetobacteraceae bacterium]
MEPRTVTLRPRPPWFGGTLQTVRALRWPFPTPLPPGHRLWLPLPDGDALASTLHLPPGSSAASAKPLAALVHGLTGSEDDPCLREAAAGLLRRGFPVLRLNLRGSAKSRPRSTSHYHLGRSADLAAALSALPETLTGGGIVVAGWSLGGALALLLLAREEERRDVAPILAGAAVCPPLQPEVAHQAMDANAVLGRALLALYRSEVLAVPARDLDADLRRAAGRATSLHEFEATVTAPRFGYPSYEVFTEMERPASALPNIRVPTLLLMGGDDPLVPADASMDGIEWGMCPAVAPLVVRGAGHCGFYDLGRESLSVRAIGAFFEGAAGGGATAAGATAAGTAAAAAARVAEPAPA